MRSGGWGRIVLVSSGAAEDGAPGLEPYAAAKAALHGLGRSLVRNAGSDGVKTNLVLPGLVATAGHRQSIPPQALERFRRLTPTGRLAREQHIAAVVTFLVSDANRSVTGASVRVGGGLNDMTTAIAPARHRRCI